MYRQLKIKEIEKEIKIITEYNKYVIQLHDTKKVPEEFMRQIMARQPNNNILSHLIKAGINTKIIKEYQASNIALMNIYDLG